MMLAQIAHCGACLSLTGKEDLVGLAELIGIIGEYGSTPNRRGALTTDRMLPALYFTIATLISISQPQGELLMEDPWTAFVL